MVLKKLLYLFFIVILFSCNNSAKITTINAFELKNLIDNSEMQLIDVRKISEFNEAYIDGADNIDFLKSDFVNNICYLDKSKPVAVYCKSGNRSKKAALIMSEIGFSYIYNLNGGILSWKENRLKVSKIDTLN